VKMLRKQHGTLFFSLGLLISTVSAGFQGCSGLVRTINKGVYRQWTQATWDQFYVERTSLCPWKIAAAGTYSDIQGAFKKNNKDAFTEWYVLQPWMSNEHCYEAIQEIIDNCLDTNNNGGNMYTTGSWNNGHEGYEIQIDPSRTDLMCWGTPNYPCGISEIGGRGVSLILCCDTLLIIANIKLENNVPGI
jgi:hypothetical protein